MWKNENNPFAVSDGLFDEHLPLNKLKVDLPPPFAGDGSQSFLAWVRQLEVAVQAALGGGKNCDDELVRILPTRLSKSAFLLWDSLPDRVKRDFPAVKERLGSAFAGVMAQTPAFPMEGPSLVDINGHDSKFPTSYVRGVVEGVEVSILIDSGASVSLISSDFRMTVPFLRSRPLRKNYIDSRAVNGQALDTLGTIDVTFHLGQTCWQHTFHVLRESTQSVLLGLDFLAKNGALLDLGRGVLEICGLTLPLL
uniref:Peptidase A2 domain-containing protein n=1 Tax=Amphiprion ocellaris TaxID=80972 RepID=A0AAQ5WXK3_AMPOC